MEAAWDGRKETAAKHSMHAGKFRHVQEKNEIFCLIFY
jgi:hypothetical protein